MKSQSKQHEINQRNFDVDNCEQLDDFPYASVLSFLPLIRFWEERANAPGGSKDLLAKTIQKRLAKAPALYQPIHDLSLIGKHKDTIDLMMSAIFPPAVKEDAIYSVNIPFNFTSFHSTPKFDELFMAASFDKSEEDINFMKASKYLAANFIILKKFYGIDISLKAPVIIRLKEPGTGLEKAYNIQVDSRFLDVVHHKKLRKLTEKQINKLMNDPHNISQWMQTLPPENFEFQGFVTYTMTDVSEQDIFSTLKDDLLEKDAIISQDKISGLEAKFRSLFQTRDLKLGLVAFDHEKGKMNDPGRKIWNSIFLDRPDNLQESDMKGSVYERAFMQAGPVIVDDLSSHENLIAIEKNMQDKGFRNVVVIPLFYDNKPIGVLELGSPTPCELNALSLLKLKDVIPLFAIAARRSIDELQNQIQAVIKEKYTAIHPTVEWRFVQAASHFVNGQENGRSPDLEPIVFKDVFPLYGQSDIRGSSVERAKAIQTDLVRHMQLGKRVVRTINELKQYPIYEELEFRLDNYIAKIKSGLASGDELTINEFITQELDPLFRQLENSDPAITKAVSAYRKALDKKLGFVYEKRKDYEESVTLINNTISAYLDEEEEKAQEKFPHYFEKYKTDGVEYTMYTGESLMRNNHFGPMYLQNLRLWQLMIMCEIARKTESLVPDLKLPLKTTHLILVYSAPLAIQFRVDEKQFDVEGTYNMRYEIVKKRIDKAMVKGSRERVTQPGKIAIIFSQHKEMVEYSKYIAFLQSRGYLTKEVEELEIEELQGVKGLQALRVTVDTGVSATAATDVSMEELLSKVE